MAYCTKTDIIGQITEDKLIGLTDDVGSGTVDDARVDEAVAAADALIDGYCGGRYSVPFSPVPVIIKSCSVDLTVYNLYARRLGAPEDWKERRGNAVKLLESISTGRVTLGANAPAQANSEAPEFESQDKVFGRDRMKGF
jgi:phage gp36-like protein